MSLDFQERSMFAIPVCRSRFLFFSFGSVVVVAAVVVVIVGVESYAIMRDCVACIAVVTAEARLRAHSR